MKVDIIRAGEMAIQENKLDFSVLENTNSSDRKAILHFTIYGIIANIIKENTPDNPRLYLTDMITEFVSLYKFDPNCRGKDSILELMKYDIKNYISSIIKDDTAETVSIELYDTIATLMN